jgi:hypothetical protein
MVMFSSKNKEMIDFVNKFGKNAGSNSKSFYYYEPDYDDVRKGTWRNFYKIDYFEFFLEDNNFDEKNYELLGIIFYLKDKKFFN